LPSVIVAVVALAVCHALYLFAVDRPFWNDDGSRFVLDVLVAAMLPIIVKKRSRTALLTGVFCLCLIFASYVWLNCFDDWATNDFFWWLYEIVIDRIEHLDWNSTAQPNAETASALRVIGGSDQVLDPIHLLGALDKHPWNNDPALPPSVSAEADEIVRLYLVYGQATALLKDIRCRRIALFARTKGQLVTYTLNLDLPKRYQFITRHRFDDPHRVLVTTRDPAFIHALDETSVAPLRWDLPGMAALRFEVDRYVAAVAALDRATPAAVGAAASAP
jgi:hypothetical protein